MRDFAAIDFETANNERTTHSIRSSNQNRTIITTGAVRYMVFVMKTQMMHQYSPKYGLR